MGNGMNKILPGLYVGNFRDAKDEEQLTNNNITHILSIHDNAKPILQDKKYLCIQASDTAEQNLMPYFRECSKFIHEARLEGGSVLVHCLAGVSRSVTVTVAYIMTATSHTWGDTLSAVRNSREVASPNYGFMRQLQKFEDEIVSDDRKWMKETYGDDPLKDYDIVEEMCKQYHDRQIAERSSPAPRASGSTSSSYPLNRQEDCVPSSTWNKLKRTGMLVDDSI